MTNKKKPKAMSDKKFIGAVEALSNTPPISNKDIVKRTKNKKK